MHPSARPARLLRLVTATLIAAACAVGVTVAPAAASGNDVLSDCIIGALKPSYSAADYREALTNVPADLGEYTDCENQIRAARDRQFAAAAKTGGTSGGSSGATTYSAASGASTATGALAGTPSGFEGDATASTTPRRTTPQPSATVEQVSDDGFLSMPVADTGAGGPTAGASDGIPLIPVVIAFSVIALTIARGLVWWSRRPELLAQGDAA